MNWYGYDLSANVSLLFTELPYPDRFRAAADAGFTAVESWWPFPTATPSPAEIDDLLRAIDQAGVQLTGLNVVAGDMAGGERGIACLPDRTQELEQGLDALLRIAQETGCRGFNLLHGQIDDAQDRGAQTDQALRSYRLAADAVAELGGTILVEPLARGLNGAYPLETAADALDLVDRAARPNLALLLDTFHLGSNGEDLVRVVEEHGDRVGHVQLADSPGRGEPGSGTLDLSAVGEALRRSGYAGTVAAEYRPTRATADTLTWCTAHGSADRLS